MCEYIGHEVNPCGCSALAILQGAYAATQETLASVEAELQKAKAEAAMFESLSKQKEALVRKLQDTLADVQQWVEADIAKSEMSDEEYAEHYEELAKIIGLKLLTEQTFIVKFEQVITVKAPLGEDVEVDDFWLRRDTELLECNYEVANEEAATVEDVIKNERLY